MYLYFGLGIFAEFLEIFSGIFLLDFIKNTLGSGQFRISIGQIMEFLVYLSHDEGSQSYDLHHMFLHSLYCAFGTGFQLVWLSHF
jgi:hypothetical protein